jgi:hypothetical protein
MRLASLLMLVIIPYVLIAQIVKFPRTNAAIDPSKRFKVVWKEATDTSDHYLILRDLKSRRWRKIVDFGRSVDFLWAPDGNSFAITNWVGSNCSEAWIGFPKDSSKHVNLEYNSPQVSENHHVYYEILRWRNSSSVLLKIWGYGEHDPDGFEKYFEADLQGRLKEVIHKNRN